MLLVLHLEEACRFPGGSNPTGANMRGQKSYRGKCQGGGRRCLKGADVLLGQMSGGRCPGGRCPKGANVLQG